ncbi:hypothetical protein [Streptomyces sp. NPDC057257]|uniref:hypothetical protein n=1 Tax=Streptomyces sp. NPDC057257 TaxID=3346071 RepID=UPI003636CA17
MRWWAGAWWVAGVLVLAACSSSAGGGSAGATSGSRSAEPSTNTPTPTSVSPSTRPSSSGSSGPSPSVSATASPSSAAGCVSGHTEVTVGPGGAVTRRLCVRPGTVVSLILEPRVDDKRWTTVQSSAPVFVVVSGWRLDPDGTTHASLRCAGTRGGSAKVTALAKAPDVAGAARPAFTLDVTVVPYTQQG